MPPEAIPPRLTAAVPILASLNMAESTAFYSEKLGFTCVHQEPAFAIVTRDEVALHFWLCDDPEIPKVTACRVQVQGIDGLYREWQPSGAIHPNGPLADKPWGMREFAVLDVHGNCLTFFERI
jgi:catechol 2,3-dioxygenase-like lactoylglutathione lyase family enzyme